jgi:FtsZ-binding cell division protein ZapB
MTNSEKVKRLYSSIKETERLIEKAEIKYNQTIICLKMEIEENKEFGNDITANKCWIDYALQNKTRMEELQAHKQKLLNMMDQITA